MGSNRILHFKDSIYIFLMTTVFSCSRYAFADCICLLFVMGMWINSPTPCGLPLDFYLSTLSAPSVCSRVWCGARKAMRGNRAGRAQARQRVLSARGAGLGGRGPRGAASAAQRPRDSTQLRRRPGSHPSPRRSSGQGRDLPQSSYFKAPSL